MKQLTVVRHGECFQHGNKTYTAEKKEFACIGCSFLQSMPPEDPELYPGISQIPQFYCNAPDQLSCHDTIFKETKQSIPQQDKANAFPALIIASVAVWGLVAWALIYFIS